MEKLFENFRGDAFGGLTAGIVALPLALAFGVSSGLGPTAGLYGAIFLSFFAALFGGTNTQISGPTAPMTAVSMVVIAAVIAKNDGNIEVALPIILGVFLVGGLLQVALGVLGLGKYIRYIPYPVVSGFMTAIGVIILITQILPAIGYYPKEDQEFVNKFKPLAEEIILENILKEEAGEGILVLEDFQETIQRAKTISETEILVESKVLAANEASGVLGAIKVLPRALKKINWIEFALALITIFIIYGFKKITTAIPSTLVSLVVVSLAAYFLKLDYKPIEQIPSGLPIPNFKIFTEFNSSSLSPYLLSSLTLALLGAIDSLLTSVVADNMTKTKHEPNKELIGQGIGNSIAAIFGGLPGAGATIRTVVNINSGGKTKLSGMIAGIVLLFILLVLGPIASKIPAAVLAGILITVGIGVMDYKGLKAIPSLPSDVKIGLIKFNMEVLIMFVVLLLSTFWNLVYAVGIGMVIASLMFMKKIGDVTARKSLIKPLSDDVAFALDNKEISSELSGKVYIKRIKGPLFFGFTSEFQKLASQIPDEAETIIIRTSLMYYIDQSGLYAFEDVVKQLLSKGKTVLLVDIQEQPKYMMERIDIIPGLIANDCIFNHYKEALDWVKSNKLKT